MRQLPEAISFMEVVGDDAVYALAERALTREERLRRAAFRSKARRRSFTLGRHAARSLLAARLSCALDEVPLVVRDDGSIGLDSDPLFASISHSGPFAAAAVAPYPVGVDVERIRSRPDRLFRFVLHPDELALRESVDLSPDRQLVLFWALKEAVLKAQRTGLRMSPKALRLEVDLASQSAVVRGERSWNARFDVRSDHVVAVAW